MRTSAFIALALLGCGGHTEGGSRDAKEGTDPAREVPAKPSDDSSGIDPRADTELGSCIEGPWEGDSPAPCAWVALGHCYETRQMACNCACPRTHDSQCLSGFDGGPDGHVRVDCN